MECPKWFLCLVVGLVGGQEVERDGAALRLAYSKIDALTQEIAQVRLDLDRCAKGLDRCRASSLEAAPDRRNEGPDDPWYVYDGTCTIVDGCLLSPNFPGTYPGLSACTVYVEPWWSGVLFVEYFSTSFSDVLYVDALWYSGELAQLGGLHGSVPQTWIQWKSWEEEVNPNPQYGWKLCRAETLPPWFITGGTCQIDRDGCLVSDSHVKNLLGFRCWYDTPCTMEIAENWTGTLDVQSFSNPGVYDAFLVDGERFGGSTKEELMLSGMHGLVASGVVEYVTPEYASCNDFRICPGELNVSGPWGDVPWVCTSTGDPCQSACTQQRTDPFDANNNGNLHDGHPRCQSAVGYVYCGPCKCIPGEEQNLVPSRLYPHFDLVSLISCSACAPGKFNNANHSSNSECQACPAGQSSLQGATACTECGAGYFSDEESLLCESCTPGYFGDVPGLSACNACERPHFTAVEKQTACQDCLVGSFFIAVEAECQPCVPGFVASSTSMALCVACEPGWFQKEPGQSACVQCSDVFGGENAQLWSTMEQDINGQWKDMSGASSVESCGCGAGSWTDAQGHCHACGEGIICNGMGVVEVVPGYFATAGDAGSVWQCHGTDWSRCPGGVPGTCARNRINTSIACEECEAFTRARGGPCEACTGPDVGFLVLAFIAIVVVLWIVYWVLAHENRAKRKEVFTLLAILGSQFMTVCQMMGVLGSLSVEWPEPFATFVELGALFNFRLDLLNLGCVVSASPLSRYVGTTFSFIALTLTMVIFHFMYIFVVHFQQFKRCMFRQFAPTLGGAVGTVFMAVFISVCSAMFQPLQCDEHPNGQQTLRSYRQVICWDSDEHRQMLIVGAVASLMPLSFLSLCVWATVTLQRRLSEGDTMFLQTYAFLFFRFRPGVEFYVLVLLFRNLMVSVVPILVTPEIELLTFTLVVMFCVLVGASTMPWAVRQANYLDIAIHTGLLFITFLAALQTRHVDDVMIGTALLVVLVAVLCFFLVAAIRCLHLFSLRLRKPFQFFLCHHKEGAGAFCRLLKMRLKVHRKVVRDVFLDSDNLQDLSLLFNIVGNQTATLVVLCSREILFRPWCVGEMTTARLHCITTVLLIFPEFQWPPPDFIVNYAMHVEGVLALAPYGIGVENVQETLHWLGTCPWIVLPEAVGLRHIDMIADELARLQKRDAPTSSDVQSVTEQGSGWRREGSISHVVSCRVDCNAPATATTVSIVDHTNPESVCTALLLKEVLKPRFPYSSPGHVLGPDENLPQNVTTLLVVCSAGCFQKVQFVRQFLQADLRGVVALPIIASRSFQFPSSVLNEELRAASHLVQGTGRSAEDLISLISTVFEEIGIHVYAQDSQAALEMRADAVATRLRAPSKTLNCPSLDRHLEDVSWHPDSDIGTIHVELDTDELWPIQL